MEPHAFASLAHLRLLVLPVGTISKCAFEEYASEIRCFDTIRLSDIPTSAKDERARFLPNPLSTGSLHLRFSSHVGPSVRAPLSLIRPSQSTLGIIGVGVCSTTQTPAVLQEQFAKLASSLASPNSFPASKVCFAFEESEEVIGATMGEGVPGVTVIPHLMGNKKLYIGTLLADLCSQILGEFGRLISVLETPIGNEHLNSTMFPIFPSPSDFSFGLDDPTSFTSSTTSQPELTSAGLSSPPDNLRRNSSTGPSINPITNNPISRQSSLGFPARKRSSTIGVASSHGRLYKVLGDMFLLAGRIADATLWYTEALVLFRSSQDPAWHASAIEGTAVILFLDSWSSGQQASMSYSKDGWNSIMETLSQVSSLYPKTPILLDSPQDHSVLTSLYVESILRQAALLLSVWVSKGWGPPAFASMLQPTSSVYAREGTSAATWSRLDDLSASSGVSRMQIATMVTQAHGPWLLHLDPYERLRALQTMAIIFSSIGYKRKEVYILREVLSCLMDLVVCGREESETPYRSDSASSASVTFPNGDNGNRSPDLVTGAIGIRLSETQEGNESLLQVLRYSCSIMGVDLGSVKLVDPSERTSIHDEEASNNSLPPLNEPFGWPELQVGMVRESIAVAEALPDHLAVASFSLSALRALHSIFNVGDQYHLHQTASKALAVAHRRGATKTVEYWSDSPIVNIEVMALPLGRLPAEKPMSLLRQENQENPVVTGGTNPFLYNPRKAGNNQGNVVLVQNEPVELVVTLHNPYVFELELQSLSLSTLGPSFNCQALSAIYIPPQSYYHASFIGKVTQTGTLTIRGCIVQAMGGAPREFTLPLPAEGDNERFSRRRTYLTSENGRIKSCGLEARSSARNAKHVGTTSSITNEKTRYLECKVLPEQPLLRMRWTSLTHDAVMLYEGEKSVIHLTLENISSLPIDFLKFSFDDSTIAPAQEALAEGELTVFETYETEYQLINRQVLSCTEDSASRGIDPGEKVTVPITCFGKVGCTSGCINIAYAYAHRPHEPDKVPGMFHTRQLSYPMNVTVYQTLECSNMTILPVDSECYSEGSLGDDVTDLCMFSIEIRNTYGLPFEVIFESTQEGVEPTVTSTIVPPGSTSRIVLLLKRFMLPDRIVSQAIPTLSDRQFVVAKTALSAEEERRQRELFWYREELLKAVKGSWKEVNGIRRGDLSLRQQRLSLPMLKSLKTDTIRLQMSLVCDDDKPLARRAGKFWPPPNEVFYVNILVSNTSETTHVLFLKLLADPNDYVLSDTLSSAIPLGRLKSGDSQTLNIPVCFISSGHFELCAEVYVSEKPGSEAMLGTRRLGACVKPEGGVCYSGFI